LSQVRQVNLFRPSVSRKLPIREDPIQRAIVIGFKTYGYRVLVTSRRRKGSVCKCGAWVVASGGDGVDKGLPDLMIRGERDPVYPPGLWHGVEVKGTDTAINDEQRKLLDLGLITIARSFDDAYDQVRALERSWGFRD
jgi:hypothetical protein